MLLYVHIGVLATVVVATAAVVVPNWGRPQRSTGAVLVAVLPFLALGVLSALLLAAKGKPGIEWALPAIAVLIAGITCRSDKAFNGLRWGLLGLAVALWLNFMFLVNGGGGFTTRPSHTLALGAMMRNAEVKAAGETLRSKLAPNADYPAGSVGELLDDPRFDAVESWSVRSEWHTPLTGLYREDRVKAPLWYPGGEVDVASHKLEVRAR